jgi:hypothetical protein
MGDVAAYKAWEPMVDFKAASSIISTSGDLKKLVIS